MTCLCGFPPSVVETKHGSHCMNRGVHSEQLYEASLIFSLHVAHMSVGGVDMRKVQQALETDYGRNVIQTLLNTYFQHVYLRSR